MFDRFRYIVIAVVLFMIAGCSGQSRESAPVVTVIDRSDSSQLAMKTRPDPHQISATDKLMKDAQSWLDKGKPVKAVATLERALRIKPRNPHIWSRLAQVRFSQKRYQQAESLALRSNQYAGANSGLKRTNWLIIADARARSGNSAGAAVARKKAESF